MVPFTQINNQKLFSIILIRVPIVIQLLFFLTSKALNNSGL